MNQIAAPSYADPQLHQTGEVKKRLVADDDQNQIKRDYNLQTGELSCL